MKENHNQLIEVSRHELGCSHFAFLQALGRGMPENRSRGPCALTGALFMLRVSRVTSEHGVQGRAGVEIQSVWRHGWQSSQGEDPDWGSEPRVQLLVGAQKLPNTEGPVL